MKGYLAAAGCVVILATSAHAKLEIKDIEAVHGDLGPVRKTLDLYPHDELVFRFNIIGLKVDAQGRADITLNIRLADANDKELLNRNNPYQPVLALGGDTAPANARLTVGEAVVPGDYLYTVTVTDNLSLASASFERKVKVKPAEFTIVMPRFFLDVEGKLASSAGGVVGQILHTHYKVVGFDRTRGNIDLGMTLRLLDKDGKDTLPKPVVTEWRDADAAKIKTAQMVNFKGSFLLNRPGDFTLRIVIDDHNAKKTTQFETLLHVVVP